MIRKLLGIFLLLSLTLMIWAIYENFALIHSAISPEIALVVVFILPIPLLILEFVIAPLCALLFHHIMRPLKPILTRYSLTRYSFCYEDEFAESIITLTWGVAICATLALMINLFLSLPESVFANITDQGLLFVIPLLYLLNVVVFLLLFYVKMKSLGLALVNKIMVAFFIISFLILSLIIGINSPDIMSAIIGTVFLFLVFPQLILLPFFLLMIFGYFIGRERGQGAGGLMFYIYLFYPIIVILGAIFGAIAFYVASIL
jgi:hypothetical protein